MFKLERGERGFVWPLGEKLAQGKQFFKTVGIMWLSIYYIICSVVAKSPHHSSESSCSALYTQRSKKEFSWSLQQVYVDLRYQEGGTGATGRVSFLGMAKSLERRKLYSFVYAGKKLLSAWGALGEKGSGAWHHKELGDGGWALGEGSKKQMLQYWCGEQWEDWEMTGKGHEDNKLFVLFLQGNEVLIEKWGELMCLDLCRVS